MIECTPQRGYCHSVYSVFLTQVSLGGGGGWRRSSVYIQTHTSSPAAVSLRGEDPPEDPRETQGKAACWSTFKAVGKGGDAAAQHQKTGIPIFSAPYVRHNQSISTHNSLHVKLCRFWSLKYEDNKGTKRSQNICLYGMAYEMNNFWRPIKLNSYFYLY